MAILQSANLILRFVLEMCALVALGYWGFHTGSTVLTKILLGLGAPLIAIVAWALFGAPAAAEQLGGPGHLALEVIMFGLAAAGLAAAGQPKLAWIFAGLFVTNRILMFIWKQ